MFPSKFPFSAGTVRCHVWLVNHGDGIGVINHLPGCTSSTQKSFPPAVWPVPPGPRLDPVPRCQRASAASATYEWAALQWISMGQSSMIYHDLPYERLFLKTMINCQRAIHKKLVVGLVLVTVSCWIRHDIPMIHQDPGFTRKLNIGSISQDI